MSSQVPGHIKTILARNIREARDARGLTQRQLGALVNDMDGMTVSRWERGRVTPSLENMTALANALGVDVAWLYTDHERKAA